MCQLCSAFRPFDTYCPYEDLENTAVVAAAQTISESSDAAGDTSTSYVMSVGDTFTGTLSTNGDRDWVEVTLTAGETYTIALDGNTLSDPYLRLYSSDGTQVALNDDGGSGLNSLLSFTATTSGTYYVGAGAYADGYTGTYTLTVNTADTSSFLPVFTNDEIALQLTEGYWTYAGYGASQVPQSFDVGADGSIDVDITSLTAAGQQFAIWALEAWTYVTGITFNYVDESTGATAEIFFDDTDSGAYASNTLSGSTIVRADVNVATNWLTYDLDSSGNAILYSYSTQTFIHEIGHALGLGHAGDYNGSANYGTTAATGDNHYLNDSWQATIMSYFSQTDNSQINASYAYIISPMIADILAIQSLYGSVALRTGDTTYGSNSNVGDYFDDLATINSNTGYAWTILDDGGTDTLDLSFATSASNVDLNDETYSDIDGGTGNLAIARGTIIENVVLGSFADTVLGNEADNRVVTGGGSDTVDGGAGTGDVVVLAGNAADYTVSTSGATTTVTGQGDTVTLTNVETIEFADGSQSIATGVTYAYYWTDGGSGAADYYYGTTYDSDGSQGLSVGMQVTITDENGNASYYYVYDSSVGNNDNLGEDQAFHRYYYDGETAQTDYDPYISSHYGHADGLGMLGSYDYVDFDDGDYTEGLYGASYYEADDEPEPTVGNTYYYYWTDGFDIYYGYTYDADGSQGLSSGARVDVTDENGNSAYYYVYSTQADNVESLGSDDEAFHTSYYNGETNMTDNDPYISRHYGHADGSGMVGSYDYVDFDDGDYSEGLYGAGYYEADDEDVSGDPGSTYFYYWTNGYDYYHGRTYDADDSQGLSIGYTYTTTDENGLSSTFVVYAQGSGNYYSMVDDQAFHYRYYDSETGQTDYGPYFSMTYGYAFGTGMLGSYDYVDFDDGDYSNGYYGENGYYEADDGTGNTYNYYWTDGADYYYGYTYDEDGSQGLSVGQLIDTTDENGVSGYYYVYSSSVGNTGGMAADDDAYHHFYYDSETGQTDYDPYISNYYGHADGLGMLGSFDYVDFDDGDYSGGYYGENGYYEADDI